MDYPKSQLYFLGVHTRVYTKKIEETPGISHGMFILESFA